MGKIKVQAKLPHLDPRLADPAVYQVLKELLSDSTTNQFLELQMSIHLHKFLGSILERKLVLAGLGSSYSSMSVLRDPSAILQVAIKSVETSLKPLKQLAKAIKVHQVKRFSLFRFTFDGEVITGDIQELLSNKMTNDLLNRMEKVTDPSKGRPWKDLIFDGLRNTQTKLEVETPETFQRKVC